MDAMPLIIGHRGASKEAPENTLAAFRLAWAQGADGIEADFRLTGDGRIVCLHDADTGRTAGKNLIVADATLDELRQLDVGTWKGEQWRGERIPLLAEILEAMPTGKRIFIELKSGPEIIGPLREVLVASGGDPEQMRILAFDDALLARVKAQLPEFKTCLNMAYRWHPLSAGRRPSRSEILDILTRIGAAGLSSKTHHSLDAQFVADLRRAGQELHVWTIDSLRSARHYRDLGVDSIMTNRPARLRAMGFPPRAMRAYT